jgi:hypothetical protein
MKKKLTDEQLLGRYNNKPDFALQVCTPKAICSHFSYTVNLELCKAALLIMFSIN